MSKPDQPPEHQPSFLTTDDFVVPKTSDENWAAIEQTFKTAHYISAVLVTERVRQEVLSGRDLTRPIGPFAIRAFALHLIQPTEGGINLETVVSTPTGSKADFVRGFMRPVLNMLPPDGFPLRLVSISRALEQMGLKVAAGVYVSTDVDYPGKQFASLVVPRIYLDQFRPAAATDRKDFAIKLAALSFAFLSNEYLKDLDAGETDSKAPEEE